jgi:hypothetical protein
MANPIVEEVIVHPIVLLGVVDHYNRMAKGTNKRVLGVLLGILYSEIHFISLLNFTNHFL